MFYIKNSESGRKPAPSPQQPDNGIDDAEFFRRHQYRQFRMRLATPDEIEICERIGGKRQYALDRRFHWSVIKQIAPGMRVRVSVLAPMPPEYPLHDIPEEVAREVFLMLAG